MVSKAAVDRPYIFDNMKAVLESPSIKCAILALCRLGDMEQATDCCLRLAECDLAF
jgi:hypothetical protein